MIKMFVTDIDHTLYDSQADGIPQANRRAIACLLERGVTVCLASSRVMPGVASCASLLGLTGRGGYAMASNGSQVIDCRDGRRLVDRPFSLADIHELYELACQAGLVFTVSQGNVDVTTAYTHIIDYDFDKVRMDVIVTHDLWAHIDQPVYHVLVSRGSQDMHQYIEPLTARTGSRFNFIVSQSGVIDISLAHIDKASGLTAVMADAGVGPDEVAVIGDNDNDVPMFALAGLSACVGDGNALARQKAGHVVASCGQGGVASFIEGFVLGAAS